MQFSLWLALAGAGVLISFTPGAGAINTMSNSLTSGFRRSIWGILGQQAALIMHCHRCAWASESLLRDPLWPSTSSATPGPPTWCTSGIRQFLHKPDLDQEKAAALRNEPAWSMFRRGLWVNLLNPKAIVFFLAFMPQFIRPDIPLLPQYLALTATVVIIDILVMWFFFAAAAKSFQRFTHDARGQTRLNRIFGVLFVAVGILLALIH